MKREFNIAIMIIRYRGLRQLTPGAIETQENFSGESGPDHRSFIYNCKKYLFESEKMKNVKNALSLTLFSVSAMVCCFSPAANATVIDFEGYGAGTIIDSEYATDLTVSAENLGSGPDVAVIFDTSNPTGGDIDLVPGYNAGNVLIIHETHNCNADSCDDPDDEASGGIFYFDFTTAITLESIDFFDIEKSENGQTAFNAIKLFDADNEIMADMFYVPGTGGDNTWGQLLFDVDGVKRIELNIAGSGAIDNITYSRARIPVPAAVWLFGSGLIGLVGFARRKKA